MSRILLAGSLAYDRVMTFPGEFKDHILPDKIHQLSVCFLISKVVEEFGGTGGNIAYNLSLFGISPKLLAAAGTDFPRYKERLEALGIDTSSVIVSDELPTAGAYIMSDMKDNQITAFAPGAGSLAYPEPFDLSDISVTLVSPTSVEDMTAVPAAAKAAGIPYFFDPGQQTSALSAAQLRESIEGADALFVNDYELAMVIEKTGWNEDELLARVRLLVVTLGSEGSRLVTKDGEVRIAPVPASLLDPTGAGDAYRAGFIAGHQKGLSDTASAKIASVIAAYAVESHGTQAHAPSREEMKARYESAYSETWPL